VSASRTGSRGFLVRDFLPGTDLIVLSAIDANTLVAGNQAFAFVGTAGFGAPGRVRAVQQDRAGTTADRTIFTADVHGDGIADLRIDLVGLFTLGAADFAL
jgi:serralysin